MMRTSVIIVNYNGGTRASENIRLVAERMPEGESEVIVVDNASGDGSRELIERAVPDVRLVARSSNGGYARGVNEGLRASSGEVVVVLNADVVPEHGAIGSLADAARDGEFALVGGLVVDAEGAADPNSSRALPGLADIIWEGVFFRQRSLPAARGSEGDVVRTEAVSGSVMALSRSSLESLGPLDEDFFLYREDVEWCRRARERGLGVGLATGARFTHEGGASTRQSEGPAFAARVLSDFHYFCDIEGVPERKVRRRWLLRLTFRSFLYRADASLGVLGRRPGSRTRGAVYRVLRDNLRTFLWSPTDGQKCHPSRLATFPQPGRRAAGDERPSVLFVVPDMDYGGVQRRVEFVTGGPLSERYHFEVLCLRRSGPIGDRVSDRVAVHEAGVTRWTSPATWRRVRDYCALLEPDVVHSGTFPADVAAFAGFGRRVPRVAVKVSMDLWMSAPLRLLDRAALAGASRVYCISDAVARVKSYLGRNGMLPVVVPHVPMLPFVESAPASFPEDAPVRVVCIGRLAAVKRVDVFLRLARALADAHPGRFSFRVLGDGKERRALEVLAMELGVAGIVDFAGAVSDVPGALAQADIVPMFSSGEGGPSSVLETIARGRVPVVLRAGGAADVLPPELQECYVDRLDVDEYVEKIMDIVSRSGHYLERVHAAKESLRARTRFHDAALDRFYGEAMGRNAGRDRTRVLHLITRLIVGGAQENTIASVERVDPTRFESHLWIGPQTGSEGSLLSDARSRGIVARILPNLVREINPFKDIAVLFQLTRLMRRERFDIVHTHSSKAGIVGRFAARLAGVPHVVHTVHGWGFHEHMHPALRWFYVTLEKVMLPWTRPLVSVSERTTRVGLESGIGEPASYRLIRSGIPLASFHPDDERRESARRALGVSSDDIVVGSVGRLSAQKNPADFVRVAAKLMPGRDRLRFLYVGDGPLRSEIERELATRGLADRVELLGLRSDVPDLLRAFDVFILTSLWEGLPRVVIQALATGVPVVAYDTAGIREAVVEGSNGHLLEPGDVDGAVERLAPLIDDASVRERMSRAAHGGFDASFSEDTMIADLERLYTELSGGE